METENKLDKLFKDALYDNEVQVPNYVWDSISADLSQKKKTRRAFFILSMAAGIAIVISFSLGLLFRQYNSDNQIVAKVNYKNDYDSLRKENKSIAFTNSVADSQLLPKIIKNKEIKQKKQLEINKNEINTIKTNNINYTKNKNNVAINNKSKSQKAKNNQSYTNNKNDFNFTNDSYTAIYANNQINIDSNKYTFITSKIDSISNNYSFVKSEIDSISKNHFFVTTTIDSISSNYVYQDNANENLNADKIKQDSIDKLVAILMDELTAKNNDMILPVTDAIVKHWRVGGQIAPMYNYRNISESGNRESLNSSGSASTYDQNEKPTVTFAGGIAVNYQTEKRWAFQTGLAYAKIGQMSNNLVITYDNSSYGSTIINYGTSAGNIQSDKSVSSALDSNFVSSDLLYSSGSILQQFEYLEIPFITRFKIIDKTFDINLLSGFSAGILIGNKAYLSSEKSKKRIGETQNINKLNVSATVGFGAEYVLTSKILLTLEPSFKYSLNTLNRDGYVNNHPYSFAVNTGIYYSF